MRRRPVFSRDGATRYRHVPICYAPETRLCSKIGSTDYPTPCSGPSILATLTTNQWHALEHARELHFYQNLCNDVLVELGLVE